MKSPGIGVIVVIFLTFAVLLAGCKKRYDYSNLTTFQGDHVNTVVQIPAGHDEPITYVVPSMNFELDSVRAGRQNGLPLAANFCFIPNTSSPGKLGNLKALLLGQRISTGKVVQGMPIGYLQLEKESEQIPVVFMKLAEGSGYTFETLIAFMLEQDQLRYALQEGLIDFFDRDEIIRFTWLDESDAVRLIKRYTLD